VFTWSRRLAGRPGGGALRFEALDFDALRFSGLHFETLRFEALRFVALRLGALHFDRRAQSFEVALSEPQLPAVTGDGAQQDSHSHDSESEREGD
jgi:hypothetical protein